MRCRRRLAAGTRHTTQVRCGSVRPLGATAYASPRTAPEAAVPDPAPPRPRPRAGLAGS